MYRRAKSITGKRPYVLVSEGIQNINLAFKDEFFTRRSRELVISNLEYRVITIATRWSGSMAKLEAEARIEKVKRFQDSRRISDLPLLHKTKSGDWECYSGNYKISANND